MTQQSDFRMPATGEGWRHYNNGTLYTIIGMATDDNGIPTVVYTPCPLDLERLRKIHTRPLSRFLQVIDDNKVFRPRFRFEREAGAVDPTFTGKGPFGSEAPATKTYTRAYILAIAREAFKRGFWAHRGKLPTYQDEEDALNKWLLRTDLFERDTL